MQVDSVGIYSTYYVSLGYIFPLLRDLDVLLLNCQSTPLLPHLLRSSSCSEFSFSKV